jgi:hypothetical protein
MIFCACSMQNFPPAFKIFHMGFRKKNEKVLHSGRVMGAL